MLSLRHSTNYLKELSLPTDCTDLGEILTAVCEKHSLFEQAKRNTSGKIENIISLTKAAKFLIANYRSGKLCKYTLDNTVPESI